MCPCCREGLAGGCIQRGGRGKGAQESTLTSLPCAAKAAGTRPALLSVFRAIQAQEPSLCGFARGVAGEPTHRRGRGSRAPALSAGFPPPPSPPSHCFLLPTPRLCFRARSSSPPPHQRKFTPTANKLSAGRRMVRKGEQLWEQEALQKYGQTDGETEPRSPSVVTGGVGQVGHQSHPHPQRSPHSPERRGQVAAGWATGCRREGPPRGLSSLAAPSEES